MIRRFTISYRAMMWPKTVQNASKIVNVGSS